MGDDRPEGGSVDHCLGSLSVLAEERAIRPEEDIARRGAGPWFVVMGLGVGSVVLVVNITIIIITRDERSDG